MNRKATLLALGLIFAVVYSGCGYAQQPGLSAKVTALQGVAQSFAGADQEPKQLQTGSDVEAWDMVSTDASGKLVLRWQNGLTAAFGEFSSLVLSSEEIEGLSAPSAQIINGIFRFAGPGSGAGSSYSVTTPSVAIYPIDANQPADFTVEVYDPQTTVVSVISGKVRVRKSTGEEKIVSSCQSFYVEEGKTSHDPFPLSGDNFKRLVADTTIPGTFVSEEISCGATAEAIPRGPEYAIPSDYYVEDWDAIDFFPYEFRVMHPPYAGAPYVIVIPGIGQWFIEIPYSVAPAYIQVYVQQIFLDHCAGFYRDHLSRWRHRRHELAGMISLARMTGNTAMLIQAQRQLNDLNLRTHWAEKQIHRFENRVAALGAEERKFGGKGPSGADLRNLIASSLNAPKNSAISSKFQDRLRTDLDVQNRLATLASREIGALDRKIAAQPDPEKRLALRQQLSSMRNDLAGGKLLIPKNEKDVSGLVKELGKVRDPGKRGQIEDRVLGQLKKVEGPETADLMTKRELGVMKQDLAKFPNPQGRQAMEQQLSALQQTVEKRKETEALAEQTSKQMEKLTTQAATERNPERRNQILNQLNELSRSVPGVLPGRGQFLPQPAAPSAGIQPSGEKQQQQIPQKKLEEQKKPTIEPLQQDKLRQQELQKQQAVDQQKQKKEEELKKQQLRQQQLEQQKQSDLKKQEELRQQQLQRQQTIEKQKQEQELKRQQSLQQQQEQQKQSELKKQEELRQRELQRQQQLERQKQQQELQKQLERQRQSEAQQQEKLRQQQLQRQQAIEQQRQQQLQQQQQQQMRRLQQEQQRQQFQTPTPAQQQNRQPAVPQGGQPQAPKGKGQMPPGFPGQ